MDYDFLNDPEFKKLIKKYLVYLKKELDQVMENIQHRKFYEIRQFGHNLKGTGSGYGFDEFTRLGGKINTAAHEEDIPAIEACVSEFEVELDKALHRNK